MGQLPLEGIWYGRKRCYFVIGVVDCGYRTRSVYRPNEIAAPAQAKTATSHDENVYRSWQDPRQRVPSVFLSYLQAFCRASVEAND